jgi:chromate transporter
VSVLELAAVILVANAITFGNGPVMIPILQERLVDEAGVLSVDQLLYAFAIARVIPGQANAYVASIGYMLHGLPGAVLATAAIQLPGYLMLPLERGYAHLRGSPAVRGFTRGLVAASVGLIVAATVGIARKTLTAPIPWVVFLLALGLGYRLKWHPVAILAIASAAGIALRVVAW